MIVNQDLINQLILYIGDVEANLPYFKAQEIKLANYSPEDIENHVAMLIEGEIIDGVFAFHESSENYGYLIGGLTTETRYLYQKLKTSKKFT